MPGARSFSPQSAAIHDFRTYFIARATNRYATMYYDIINSGAGMFNQGFYTALKNPARSASPATMEQGDRLSDGVDEVYRNAVSNGDRQEQTGGGGGMPIDAFDLHPTLPSMVPGHFGFVDLIAQDCGLEAGFRPPEGPPPRHNLSDRCLGPQTEVKSPAFALSSAGYSGDDLVFLAPAGDFVPRHLAG